MSSPLAPQYYRQLMDSRPPGAYSDDEDSLQAIILGGASEGLGVSLEQVNALQLEVFPQTAEECLEDWEQLYNIAVPVDASLADRRATLLGLVRGGKPVSIPGFSEQMDPVLGEGCWTLYENLIADVSPEDEQVFFAFVWRDPAQPGTYDIAAAQRLATRAKEAHLLVLVGESNCFLTNDPFSRTNRDILGA